MKKPDNRMNMPNFILLLAVLATALIAGLYYSYSCSVNPGLAKLPDTEYVSAMQSINLAIQNPVFFASFFGALLLLPLAAWQQFQAGDKTRCYLLLAAAVIYAFGSMAVTVFGNVPLNNALAGLARTKALPADIHSARLAFEKPWNNLHAIRTIATILSLVLATAACLATAERHDQ